MDVAGPTAVSALTFAAASRAEGLLAAHKDEAYREQLLEQLTTACSLLLGSRQATLWQRQLQACSATLYFGLTTGCGRQTPGDEYCDLTLVRSADG